MLLQPGHRCLRRRSSQLREPTAPAKRIHDQQLQHPGLRAGIQPGRDQPMEPAVDLGADLGRQPVQRGVGRQLAALLRQLLQRHIDHISWVVLAQQRLPHR
jgi:hypothetical protein